MKTAIVLAIAMISSAAFADGFVCESATENLKIKVYNQTEPSEGTRNAAVMVVSDPSVSHGRKTIAKFEATDVLSNVGATYTADVDLRYTDSSRKGELIADTKLGELANIILDVEFSYNQPVVAGAEVAGVVSLVKRDGEVLQYAVACKRYLKG